MSNESEQQALRDKLFPPNFTSKAPPKPEKEIPPPCRHPRRVNPLDIDYGYNPRRSINPMYEQIKADILFKGDLDHPIPITHNPETGKFKTYGGGNTRLKIVKGAWAERDERFKKVRCEYYPSYEKAEEIYAAGMENYLRGQLSFIDLALWMQDVKEAWEKSLEIKLSVRDLEKWLAKMAGWNKDKDEGGKPKSPSHMTIYRWLLAANYYQFIPLALNGGLGRRGVEALNKLEKSGYSLFVHHSPVTLGYSLTKDDYIKTIFGHTISLVDHSTEFNIQLATESLLKYLAEQLAIEQAELAEQLAYVQKGGDLKEYQHKETAEPEVPAEPEAEPDVKSEAKTSNSPLSWDNARSLLLKMADHPQKKRVAELPVIFDELEEVDDLLAIRCALDARIAEKQVGAS